MQLFYISFPFEGPEKLIPYINSQTVSNQANNSLRNAELHTQRQMSGNVCIFPSRNVLFQISSDPVKHYEGIFGEGKLTLQQICSESLSVMRETEVFPLEEQGRLQRCQNVSNEHIL